MHAWKRSPVSCPQTAERRSPDRQPPLRGRHPISQDLKKQHKVDFGKELDTEHKAWKTIWSAGQGSTTVEDVLPVAELVDRLKSEFKSAIEEQAAVLNQFPK